MAVLTALLGDPGTVREAYAVAAPVADRWSAAARHGLADPALAAAAAALLDLALPALPRLDLPTGTHDEIHARSCAGGWPPQRGETSDARVTGASHAVATEAPTEQLRDRIAAELARTRARTALLTEAVDDADLVRQHSPLMSPLVWDLAHVGNQEELWLVRDVGGREPVRCDIDELYDAFKQPRRDRPALPLLPPAEARAYLATVRDKVLDLLDARGASPSGRWSPTGSPSA